MNDRIFIRGLGVDARVGATAEERLRPQRVLVDVLVDADLSRAAASDDLDDTIDYGRVVSTVAGVIRSSEANLLEHLAGRVVSVVSRMDGVQRVTVEIAKESPPVSEEVAAIAVRIVGKGQ